MEQNIIALWQNYQENKKEENKTALFQAIQSSKFWVPVIIRQQDGEEKLQLAVLSSAQGGQFIPAFLSKEEDLGTFQAEELQSLPYDLLKHLVIDDPERLQGVVISPFAHNIILDQVLMTAIDAAVEGMTVQKTSTQGKLLLQKPVHIPDGLQEALQRFLADCLEVNAAWLLVAKREEENAFHWLILLDFYGERVEVFPKVAKAIQPYLKPGDRFELLAKNQAIPTELLAQTLLYQRENQNC